MSNKIFFSTRRIRFNGNYIRLVTQSRNGPCPLIAICNYFILNGIWSLGEHDCRVAALDLVEEIIRVTYPGAHDVENQNYLRTHLIRMIDGLDVNPMFTGADKFEKSPEIGIFPLLKIPLLHGWVVSKDDEYIYSKVSGLTYNELVDKIITYRETAARLEQDTSNMPENTTQAAIVVPHWDEEAFLTGETLSHFIESTSNQLTLAGIISLHENLQCGKMCVFFRNNHFSILYRRSEMDPLFCLVSDESFNDTDIVWEELDDGHGGGRFFNCDFARSEPNSQQRIARQASRNNHMGRQTRHTLSGTGGGRQVRRSTFSDARPQMIGQPANGHAAQNNVYDAYGGGNGFQRDRFSQRQEQPKCCDCTIM